MRFTMNDKFKKYPDFWKRKIQFTVCEQTTQHQVDIKLEPNEDGLKRLEKGVADYAKKQIAKVLPLSMFDDFKEESERLRNIILDKRKRLKRDLMCMI